MPFNGSGSFSVYTPGNPAVTGTTISSTAFNNTMNDFATGFNNTMTRDGQSPATANIPLGGNKLTGVGNGTARTDALPVGQFQDGAPVYLTGVAGTDTITASLTPAITAYAAGQTFRFVSAGANTGAVTLNVNGLGAKSITKTGAVALVAGDILSGSALSVMYDGTQFQLQTLASVTNATNATYLRGPARSDVASAATVDLTSTSDDIRLTGTATITAVTVAAGRVVRVTAGGAFTLTNNANIITQTGANIIAFSGDTFMLRATAANTVEVLNYTTVGRITLGTSVATTSGTSIDFTGIPSWVKRITMTLVNVSTSGTSLPQVQVGSGSVTTSGYGFIAGAVLNANVTSTVGATTGFVLTSNVTAASYLMGQIVLTLTSANTWTCSLNCADGSANRIILGSGNIALGGALDRVRLTTVGGTDTFDAGSVNIIYE